MKIELELDKAELWFIIALIENTTAFVKETGRATKNSVFLSQKLRKEFRKNFDNV